MKAELAYTYQRSTKHQHATQNETKSSKRLLNTPQAYSTVICLEISHLVIEVYIIYHGYQIL